MMTLPGEEGDAASDGDGDVDANSAPVVWEAGIAEDADGDADSDSEGDLALEEADGDGEELTEEQVAELSRRCHEKRLEMRAPDLELPPTTTRLGLDRGGLRADVFLIGTAHYSEVSNAEVAALIRQVCPDGVVLELDPSRANILVMDDRRLIEEARSYNLAVFRRQAAANGVWFALLHYFLLRMSFALVEQLGMAPGGEFRAAARASVDVPGCVLYYGDRPVGLTLQRAFSQLSLTSKLRLAWTLLSSIGPITREDVERLKQHDLVEAMVRDLQDQFPVLSRVFVDERDRYLARAIFDHASRRPPPHFLHTPTAPRVVVAVVGMGHVAGIARYWDTAEDICRRELCELPATSSRARLLGRGLRWAALGALLYGGCRLAQGAWSRLRGWLG